MINTQNTIASYVPILKTLSDDRFYKFSGIEKQYTMNHIIYHVKPVCYLVLHI